MKLCVRCRQHVFRHETSCPFCSIPLRDTTAQVALTLGLAAAVVGCGPQVGLDTGADTTQTGSTSIASGTTMQTTVSMSTSTTAMGTTMVPGSTSTADSTGSTFINNPDGGGALYGECDIFAQDCPVGDKCTPWANDGGTAWNATRCSPIARNPSQAGEPCTTENSSASGLDDCDAGMMCFDVDQETLQGTCYEFCTGDES